MDNVRPGACAPEHVALFLASTVVCPVVNLFDDMVVTDRSGEILDRWAVATRGRLS